MSNIFLAKLPRISISTRLGFYGATRIPAVGPVMRVSQQAVDRLQLPPSANFGLKARILVRLVQFDTIELLRIR
jgi:hypothetical protein